MPIIERSMAESERGSLLVVVLTLILAALYLAALVIDLTKVQRINRILQRSADAASLAAAAQLVLTSDTDFVRWTNAKRAAIASLRNNLAVTGYTLPDIHSVGTHQGILDICETAADYRPVTYDNGEYRITLERGRYEDDEPAVFDAMESSDTCRAEELPSANSMRVTIVAYGPSLSFSALIGLRTFRNITVSAIGAQVTSLTAP